MIINNEVARSLKADFPVLNEGLVYLDNASTTQKPDSVIKTCKNFYEKYNANVHRSVYKLGEEATKLYETSRKISADFIGANPEEIIFTSGFTDSINLLTNSISSIIPKEKNEIVISIAEHHSNFVPWQEFAKKNKMKLHVVGLKKDLSVNTREARRLIGKNTAIVAISHISNVTGIQNNIEKILKYANKYGAISVVDACQSISRVPINVKKLNCSFLSFSGHKMYGPFGIGVLYGKKELLEKIEPFKFGGGMVEEVFENYSKYQKTPYKFEAGTPNVEGAIGLARAVRILEKYKPEHIARWENELVSYAVKELEYLSGVEVYGKSQKGIISFNLKGVHPHDVGSLLSDQNIAIRVGHHCAMPLIDALNVPATCRISFAYYNTFEDIELLIRALRKVKEKFSR